MPISCTVMFFCAVFLAVFRAQEFALANVAHDLDKETVSQNVGRKIGALQMLKIVRVLRIILELS